MQPTECVMNLAPKGIVTYTFSGRTALYLSKSRPFAPIIAFTNNREIARQMRLFWGVEPIYNGNIHSNGDIRKLASKYFIENKHAKAGDNIIVMSSRPFGVVKHTNGVEIMEVVEQNSVEDQVE